MKISFIVLWTVSPDVSIPLGTGFLLSPAVLKPHVFTCLYLCCQGHIQHIKKCHILLKISLDPLPFELKLVHNYYINRLCYQWVFKAVLRSPHCDQNIQRQYSTKSFHNSRFAPLAHMEFACSRFGWVGLSLADFKKTITQNK